MHTWPPKDPDEVLDYQVDWSARLDTGEVITTSVFSIVAGTVTIDSQSFNGALSTVWLSGGTEGETNVLSCEIETDEGRTYNESVRLRIRTR